MGWWRRLRSRNARARDRAEEISAHLHLYAEELIARGLTPDEARRQARLRFGNPRVKLEEVDALNGLAWLDGLRRDTQYALRTLAANPGFTAVVLAVLTLGIGASTAIFSVVDAVVLRGLPFDESDRLIGISRIDLRDGSAEVAGFDAPDAADYRQQQDVFEALAAVPEGPRTFVLRGDPPEEIYGTRSTADLFAVLRVRPQLGRMFAAEHEIEGNHRVAVISDGLWRRRFGANPDIVGKPLVMGSMTREILGVMPPGFSWPVGVPQRVDIWVPWVVPANEKSREGGRVRYLSLIGRLKPGVSVDQAQARMDQIRQALANDHPLWFKDEGLQVRPLVDAIVGDRVRSWMLMLLGAVVCVLLIACVNVANLLLARTAARSHELRIRSALGASRWQLVRGILAESLILTTIGTVLAVVFVYWTVDVMRAVMPAGVPRLSTVAINMRILGTAAVAAAVCGLLMGLGPGIQLSKPSVAGALRSSSRPHAASGRSRHLRTVLIVAEVALAVVLLVGCGLFVSSFVRIMRVDMGFDHRHVLTFSAYPRIDLSSTQAELDTYARADALVNSLIDRLRALPGVKSAAALSGGLPLTSSWTRVVVEARGRNFTGDADMVDIRQTTPEYLDVMRLRLLHGRWLTTADIKGSEQVVVLNDVAARRYLGTDRALGSDLRFQQKTWKVVGVVQGIRFGGPESDVRPEAYVSLAQSPIIGGNIVIRSDDDPLALIPAVEAAVRAIAPSQTPPDVRSLDAIFGGLIATRRFNMLLLSLFGFLGIVIATIGVYGVMAFLVTQRAHDIGVRMALGADSATVLRSVLWHAGRYLLIGLAMGVVVASSVARLVESLLFRVAPHDVVVYTAAAALILLSGLAAAWIPARRAARVDPLVALRIS